MEKPSNKMKTHDFMNVESFSQLPFIRQTEEQKERPIRLFGFEFGTPQETHQESDSKAQNSSNNKDDDDDDEEDEDQSINKSYVDNNTTTNSSNNNSRRFECHYCCRNFPTSQALGGHQNAHKRERQHAKRVHLLSTANANANAAFSYGFGVPTSTPPPPSSAFSYPWTNSRVFGSHHYGGVAGAYNSPINGSRLGFWRSYGASPATLDRDRSSNKNQSLRFTPSSCVVGGGSSTRSMLYEPKTSVQDHVSLDLHL